MSLDHIYLDNNASTGLAPEVLDAMLYDLSSTPRNPSSVHFFGQEARNEMTKARRSIAQGLGVFPEELIFTSGATEANNFILKGFFEQIFPKTVITTRLEHSSVFDLVEDYQRRGGHVIYLDGGKHGAAQKEQLEQVIDQNVGLIALMAANNETGVKTDLEGIAEIARHYKIPFFSDGVAILGKEPFKIHQGISAMSFSGHKFHGPKGAGLCYLSQQYELPALMLGGAQENQMRAGTQNLAGVLGLAKAFEIVQTQSNEVYTKIKNLRDDFEEILFSQLSGVSINGTGERVCNTSNLSFSGIDGEGLLLNLDMMKIAASHGAACSTGSLEPSRVLRAMGYNLKQAASSIRFSLSRYTTHLEVQKAASVLVEIINKMRA